MTNDVQFWWNSLCVIAAFNIAVWLGSALVFKRYRHELSPKQYLLRRAQLLLSGVYVFGCAFRSFFPVYDIPRLTLSTHWFANAFVGRSVATIAELCFVAQWALVLQQVHERTGGRLARIAARSMLPMIVVAELCSWYSVLTTDNIGHVVEESLWGFAAGFLVAGLLTSVSWTSAKLTTLFHVVALTAGAYVLYIFMVDVPMYWARWVTDQAHQHHYLGIMQGIFDAAQRQVVSHNWHDWKSEVIWMSVYFSVAVWLSIALAHVPDPVQVPDDDSPDQNNAGISR